jgi:hypothetical protein
MVIRNMGVYVRIDKFQRCSSAGKWETAGSVPPAQLSTALVGQQQLWGQQLAMAALEATLRDHTLLPLFQFFK